MAARVCPENVRSAHQSMHHLVADAEWDDRLVLIKYRVITVIHYNRQRAYIRHVFTHPEYDDWSYEMRKTKRSKR